MILNSKLSEDNIDKNLILITYLGTLNKLKSYLIKSEYSTNDNDISVIVVQMASGAKEIMYEGYLYDYFTIQVFGKSIREQKQTAYELGLLAGENITFNYNGRIYQLLFKELSNPTNIFYEDIRRVGYTMTLQVVIKERS